MTTDAAQKFAALIRDDSVEKPEIEAAVRELMMSASESLEQANDVLSSLAEMINIPNRVRGGFISVVCGGLVEQGCDPTPMARPITEALETVLPSCVQLMEATAAETPELDEDDEETDWHELFEQNLEHIKERMPDQAPDWKALEAYWRAAVVAYSLLSDARHQASHLRSPAEALTDTHEAGHWLGKLLSVLDDEPMIAIDPEKRTGIVGRMSGIAENFQLSAMLMDVFPNPGFLKRRRISKSAAAVARGDGPQMGNEVLTAPWNLYTYGAIRDVQSLGKKGEQGSSEHWIWNEGIPDDIPVACGKRVIVIGEPSYPRMFQSQRMFAMLKASIEIDQTLTADEVDQWVSRLSMI